MLKVLFGEELAGRERSSLATRRAAAAFPTGKTFESWEPAASSIPTPTQSALRTLEWVRRRENLVVCGPSGTGKTMFLEALGQLAVDAGMKVAWFALEDLGALVRRHRADDTVTPRGGTHPALGARRRRRHRAVAGEPRRSRGPLAWLTPRMRNVAWRSARTSTRRTSTS